jgi:hypothetical protein
MSKATTTKVLDDEKVEAQLLEQRKVKSLEKIAASLDALTLWFEEINKDEWSERFAWYLYEFHRKFVSEKDPKENPEVNPEETIDLNG